MHRLLTLVAALAVFAAAPAGGSNTVLSVEGPLTLSKKEAPLLLKQCSRSAPIAEGALWLPSKTQVAEVEARLEKHMATVQVGTRSTPAASGQYRGQYVGFMRGNVKHIYAAYVPARAALASSGHAVIVCDGGNFFWGIVYNTATGEFTELKVNGR